MTADVAVIQSSVLFAAHSLIAANGHGIPPNKPLMQAFLETSDCFPLNGLRSLLNLQAAVAEFILTGSEKRERKSLYTSRA